jgi:hypothetical protein
MSIVAQEMNSGDMDRIPHPILKDFEKVLSSYIGVLSRFIVQRQYEKISEGSSVLTEDYAEKVSDSILEEASLLIGNGKTEDIRSVYREIIENHYKEETDNE